MKLIWKLKRFLLRIEDRLVTKRFCKDIISCEEYFKWISTSKDRWWDICEQGKENGWIK